MPRVLPSKTPGSLINREHAGRILSTIPTYPTSTDPKASGNGYGIMSGTSMAAPFVSAAAALVWAAHPEFTRDQVVDRLREGADDLGIVGWDAQFGRGRINLARSM